MKGELEQVFLQQLCMEHDMMMYPILLKIVYLRTTAVAAISLSEYFPKLELMAN